jgi:hypothetical protein
VTESIMTVLVPFSLAVVVVGLLVPWLIRFKIPGLEAEIRQSTEAVGQGPKGEAVFGTTAPTITSGPR